MLLVQSMLDKLTAVIVIITVIISNNLSIEILVHWCEGKLTERDNEKPREFNNLVIFITWIFPSTKKYRSLSASATRERFLKQFQPPLSHSFSPRENWCLIGHVVDVISCVRRCWLLSFFYGSSGSENEIFFRPRLPGNNQRINQTTVLYQSTILSVKRCDQK